eukprot:NODE_406_length_9252_cov_0.363269.p6 type:complete len:111 gc:universal NODE_406_length_9252_cov_0.363269:2784-2452(-)
MLPGLQPLWHPHRMSPLRSPLFLPVDQTRQSSAPQTLLSHPNLRHHSHFASLHRLTGLFWSCLSYFAATTQDSLPYRSSAVLCLHSPLPCPCIWCTGTDRSAGLALQVPY